MEENGAWIGLKKHYGAEIHSGFWVQWDSDKPEGEQLLVGATIYGRRTRLVRNRFYRAAQKCHLETSAADLEQDSDGSVLFTLYCDAATFSNFDATFRTLVEGWTGILSNIDGGLQQYLPTRTVMSVSGEVEEHNLQRSTPAPPG